MGEFAPVIPLGIPPVGLPKHLALGCAYEQRRKAGSKQVGPCALLSTVAEYWRGTGDGYPEEPGPMKGDEKTQ